jgi:phosphoribosylformylglycinamidine synthase PurS subunit
MKATVHVTLKNALGTLGFNGIEGARIGKYIELDLAETNATKAKTQVTEMCEKLLANTVIENFRVEVDG